MGKKILLWRKYCSEYYREKENSAVNTAGRRKILQWENTAVGENTAGRKCCSGKKYCSGKNTGVNTAGRKKILQGGKYCSMEKYCGMEKYCRGKGVWRWGGGGEVDYIPIATLSPPERLLH